MATYSDTASTISAFDFSKHSTWTTANVDPWTTSNGDPIVMEKEKPKPMKKLIKKNFEFSYEVFKWYFGLFPKQLEKAATIYKMLLHSPIYNKNSNIIKDFVKLYNIPTSKLEGVSSLKNKRRFVVDTLDTEYMDYITHGFVFNTIFVTGVLEHLPNYMTKALFIRDIINRLYKSTGHAIIHTLSEEHLYNIAKKCNLPSDGNGYLITNTKGKQIKIQGIDADELDVILAYARVHSIVKTNNKLFKKFNDGCVILKHQ